MRGPGGGCPIAIPVNVRLRRKNDPTTTVAHAADMIRELADWMAGRCFHLCADGAYASLAGAGLPRTHVTSRICVATPPSMRPRHPPPGAAVAPAPKASGCPPHLSSPPRPGAVTGNE